MYEFIHGPCPHFSETSGVSTLLDNFHKQDRTLIYQIRKVLTISRLNDTWAVKWKFYKCYTKIFKRKVVYRGAKRNVRLEVGAVGGWLLSFQADH